MQNVHDLTHLLVCPTSRQPLRALPAAGAEPYLRTPRERLTALRKTYPGDSSPPFGPTTEILVRKDGSAAYPVIDGVPVLLAPEVLGSVDDEHGFDRSDPRYAEAYQEMTFYNEISSKEAENIFQSESYGVVEPATMATPEMVESFPRPKQVWIDSVYDCAAQWDAYTHISPVQGGRVLQLGGKGAHAVKFLLAGARESWALTPMLGEARCARALAEAVDVSERLRCVVALAEELPFADSSFDAVYSGGCLHHTVTSLAVPEIHRVLKPGGRFAAVDPWHAPLYTIGTNMLGKREHGAFCRPLTAERVEPLHRAFGRAGAVLQHGTLTRYPLLALHKLGITWTLRAVWRINKLDDALCARIPRLRALGSSVACLGTK